MGNDLKMSFPVSHTLAEMSYQLYEGIAEDYTKLDKYRGEDIDLILEAIDEKNNLIIMDAGCGPGRHIGQCVKLISRKINKIIGLDYSNKMLELAKLNISNSKNVELKRQNILAIDLPDSYMDIIISMNNVLGNLMEKYISDAHIARQKALQHFYRMLKRTGKCVLSVYNLEMLDLRKDYHDNSLLIEQKLSIPTNGDFVIKLTRGQKEFWYYTHWFKKDELIRLLSEVGFNVLDVVSREKRLLIICQKS